MARIICFSKINTKQVIFIVFFVAIVGALSFISACVKDDNCKDCRIQTYENGALVSSGDWVEYCDQALRDVEGQTSTVGNMTTKMVCR
ncbi:MAG: hypothetical protein BWY70_00073 [Bacteroidetes bacterium ADurb.Bin408]|nr:MAG: hypothetical protein BWY70_00073 [Bacteroidetes bacterium ADurb.Bin408]